jgi:hypothetical protein
MRAKNIDIFALIFVCIKSKQLTVLAVKFFVGNVKQKVAHLPNMPVGRLSKYDGCVCFIGG